MNNLFSILVALICSHLCAFEISNQFASTDAGYGDSNSEVNGEFLLLDILLRPSDVVFDIGAHEGSPKHVVLVL